MELRHLKTFQVVAEQLNLTKAAEQLGYSQPGITLQIKALEKELGRTLFARVGRQTYLTAAGKLLKTHVDRLFGVMHELEDDFKKLDQPYGPLVVSGAEFYCSHYMPTIIKRYTKSFPDVRLSLISADSADTAKRVFSNQADVGIVAGNCDYPDLEVVPINEEDFVMVASPAVVQGRSYMEVLTGYPFLRNGVLEKLGEKIMEEVTFTPPAVIECSSEETIKQTAIRQGGVCAVGEDVVSDELATGELVVIYRFRKKMITSLIFLKDRADEASIRAFVSLVQKEWTQSRKSGLVK